MKTKKRKTTKITVPTALALICCFAVILIINNQPTENTAKDEIISLKDIPDYSGSAFIEINGNEPYFSDDDYTTSSFEYYADLDELGRCGTAYACVGTDIMPTEERGQIGKIKPSGWQTVKYDFIDGKYLYNRCHLIAYQLTGENANEKNLITGTRYLNVTGMLPFEKMVANYVKTTGNHALYRVTPVFENDDLVAKGVLIEAKSVEDKGEGVTLCVYCYNVQPNVTINYKTGKSEYNENGILNKFPQCINLHYGNFSYYDLLHNLYSCQNIFLEI